MKRCSSLIVRIVLCFILFGLSITGTALAEKKGLVTQADGQVKKQSTLDESWQNAPVNSDVLSGDRVRTYRQSRAELNLADLDMIRIAPKTTIHILKLYEESKEKKMQTAIDLEQGELWASVHQIEANTEFDISAPIAAAAITGTVLRLSVDDDEKTQLKVYEGEVKIRNKPQTMKPQSNSLAPREVPGPTEIPGPTEVTVEQWFHIIQAMQQITIDKNGTVLSKSKFSDQDADETSDWVKWNKELDNRRLKALH